MIKAKPIYVDINDSFLIDENKIEKKISHKTKAILIVSLFGQMPNFRTIKKISKKYSLPIIEDAAQSFGAKQNNKLSCSLADISCTSFFPTKTLGGYGDGGSCFTNNKVISDKIFKLRNHGKDKLNNFTLIGYNSRLDTIQAAILLAKLKVFEKEIKLRNSVANNYDNLINDLNINIITPIIAKNNLSVYAQYTISSEHRDKIANHFTKKNIPFGIYYKKLINDHKVYYDKDAFLPNANIIKNKVISLPFNPYLSQLHQKKIVYEIKKALTS